MPSDPQRPAWWRIPSPSVLLLVLLLSFLPWIEIGCESKVGKTVFATQSGHQIAIGSHTEHNPFGDSSNGGKKGAVVPSHPARGQMGSNKELPEAAPLLVIYFMSVLAAIVAGFAMPTSRMRILVVGGLTVAALVVLLIQSVVLGFPMVNEVAKQMKQANAAQSVIGLDAGGVFVRYTVWYWLTWAMLVGAFVPLVVEEMWKRRKTGAPTLWQ